MSNSTYKSCSTGRPVGRDIAGNKLERGDYVMVLKADNLRDKEPPLSGEVLEYRYLAAGNRLVCKRPGDKGKPYPFKMKSTWVGRLTKEAARRKLSASIFRQALEDSAGATIAEARQALEDETVQEFRERARSEFLAITERPPFTPTFTDTATFREDNTMEQTIHIQDSTFVNGRDVTLMDDAELIVAIEKQQKHIEAIGKLTDLGSKRIKQLEEDARATLNRLVTLLDERAEP